MENTASDNDGCDYAAHVSGYPLVHGTGNSNDTANNACVDLHRNAYGLFRHMDERRKVILLVALTLPLSACLNPSSLLLGGSNPAVSATAVGTQMGKENTQQAVAQQTSQEAGRDIVVTDLDAGGSENVTVNNEPSLWFMILLVLGWLLPSPNEMARWMRDVLGVTRWVSSSRKEVSKSSKA